MDEHLVRLLTETQSSSEGPRTHAEQQLQQLYYDTAFPHSLLSLASQDAISLPVRQSALLTLKHFVLAGWSPSIDDFRGTVLIPSEEHKDALRTGLLTLATSATAPRRIQSAAAYVVAKIAAADFPDLWRGLLPSLLDIVSKQAEPGRTYGALRVLAELVEDGLNEQQFFGVAQELLEALFSVARDEGKPPGMRALAVDVFKGCFDTLEMILEDHKAAIKAFAETAIAAWMPLLKNVVRSKLPPASAEFSQEHYNGHIALKVQVVKVLMKIRMVFPSVIAPQSVELFSAIWDELSTLQPIYQQIYLEDEQEGRLEDADGLPYSLDFLVLEDLDFMQSCIRAPPVRKELEAQLKNQNTTNGNGNSQSSWVTDVLRLVVFYSQITTEEEGLWQVDPNLFLSEETSVTSNYTARTACGDFVIKLGEWLSTPVLESLLSYTRTLFTADSGWRLQESALYILNTIVADWQDVDRSIDSGLSTAFFEFTQHAMQQPQDFLRARGFMVGSVIVKASDGAMQDIGGSLLEVILRSVAEDRSDIVRVSGIRALQSLLSCLPPTYTVQYQTSIISTLATWIASHNTTELAESDDLITVLLETLRDAILVDTRIAIGGDALATLFNVASRGASNFQITTLVSEVFEEICSTIAALGTETYNQLIENVMPTLMGASDNAPFTEENALINLAFELLTSLTHYARAPFPSNFIPIIFPNLTPYLMQSTTPELLKSCTSSLQHLLKNDPQQLFSFQYPFSDQSANRSDQDGLQVLLHIISRLLSPAIPDGGASEVGSLAATLVEIAGADRLGPYLPQLLQAIVVRLATAVQAQMIQSLILVFARLCLQNAKDIVDFLAGLEVPIPSNGESSNDNGVQHQTPTSALHTLLNIWLTNSTTFAGASAITLNIHALARIYLLHDPRVAAIPVKGDLVVNPEHKGRIMTRSRAKMNPDTWTTVSAEVKIIKVLCEEIVPLAGGGNGASNMGMKSGLKTGTNGTHPTDDLDIDDNDSAGSDSDWESDTGILDLGLGSTKEALMAWGNDDDDNNDMTSKRGDMDNDNEETQGFLKRFFEEIVKEAGFEDGVWRWLGDGEREKVEGLVGG